MKYVIILCVLVAIGATAYWYERKNNGDITPTPKYWLILHRRSQKELLYKGVPGDASKSTLVRTFEVKTGIPGERPTPLPQLTGREYWSIVAKEKVTDNPETAPYFLTLDVPGWEREPYGPVPYMECDGQCNWILPGKFGLHGINGKIDRIGVDNEGSSGCVRHRDEDIAYLYNLLNPASEPVRYYIRDI